MKSVLKWLSGFDYHRVTACFIVIVCAIMTAYALYRVGTFLSYKSIEHYIEKKIVQMVREEALR
jgi:hypothetical protein